jgi:hypothetical protein
LLTKLGILRWLFAGNRAGAKARLYFGICGTTEQAAEKGFLDRGRQERISLRG